MTILAVMGDAVPAVQAAASAETGTNDPNGFTDAMERFVLSGHEVAAG